MAGSGPEPPCGVVGEGERGEEEAAAEEVAERVRFFLEFVFLSAAGWSWSGEGCDVGGEEEDERVMGRELSRWWE